MTRQKNNQETFSETEATELGAFNDDALTEDEALAAQDNTGESEATNE